MSEPEPIRSPRRITFPSEYRRDGVRILHTLARAIDEIPPESSATVHITQEALTVRMTTETQAGFNELLSLDMETCSQLGHQIVREVDFPPEYRQPGIGVMSYFAEVIQQKHPLIPATLDIALEGNLIRLTIEIDVAHQDLIEDTLNQYGLVISGRQRPDVFLSQQADIIRLENQLTHVRAQLESERRLMELMKNEQAGRIASLEEEVVYLRQLVGDQMRHSDRLVDVLEIQALMPLNAMLARTLTAADEAEVKRHLISAGQQSPSTLQRLAEVIMAGTISGVNAALLTPWLQEVANQLGIVIRLAG